MSSTPNRHDQSSFPSTVVGGDRRSVTSSNQSDEKSSLSTLALDGNEASGTLPDQTDQKPVISALAGGNDCLADITSLPQPPSDIPDRGLKAYLQVLGAHFLILNSWGIINAFGAYQDYYETSSFLSQTPSTISWIGTIQGFILALAGSITGPIYDRGYFRHLIFTGTFLVTLGTTMTSLCSSYYQLVLAQDICVGLGAACFWVPSAAILATYFESKRNLMMAIAVAGSAIGSIIYPIVFRRLQPTIGFGWATRVIGLIVLVLCSISCAVMKPRIQPPTQPRALIDWSAFREGPFVLISLGMFFSYTGVYIPFFYSQIYGSRVIGLDNKVSFYLLPVISAGSIFGRVIPGLIADKAGPLNVLIPLGTVTAGLTFAWLSITDAPGLWIFCGLYGFFSGAFIFLPPTIIAGLTPDMTRVGTRLGMSFTFAGFGLLIGNPIAGTIVDIPDGEFHGAQLFSAATITTGVAMFILAWVLITRSRKVLKASLCTPSQALEADIVPV